MLSKYTNKIVFAHSENTYLIFSDTYCIEKYFKISSDFSHHVSVVVTMKSKISLKRDFLAIPAKNQMRRKIKNFINNTVNGVPNKMASYTTTTSSRHNQRRKSKTLCYTRTNAHLWYLDS